MIDIVERSPALLERYADIPMIFAVAHRIEVSGRRSGSIELERAPRSVDPCWTKDYDAAPSPDERGECDRS